MLYSLPTKETDMEHYNFHYKDIKKLLEIFSNLPSFYCIQNQCIGHIYQRQMSLKQTRKKQQQSINILGINICLIIQQLHNNVHYNKVTTNNKILASD